VRRHIILVNLFFVTSRLSRLGSNGSQGDVSREGTSALVGGNVSLSRCARLCGVFTVYSVCNVHNAELTQRVLMELVLKLLSIVS
jgi:hypothetical protein